MSDLEPQEDVHYRQDLTGYTVDGQICRICTCGFLSVGPGAERDFFVHLGYDIDG